MSMSRTAVVLTNEELAALDGICSEKVQAEVEKACHRIAAAEQYPDLTAAQAAFVSDVVLAAEREGRLIYRHESVRRCDVCERSLGYAKYKSGRNKGRDNYSKPLTSPGVELVHRFIHWQGSPSLGCCKDCFDAVAETLRGALSSVRCELPAQLHSGDAPQFKHYDNRRCTECGWEGGENLMGRLPTIMGPGTYAGRCPKCAAEQNPFGRRVFELADGFTLVES